MRKLIRHLKCKLSWMRILNSPFKRPNIILYFGNIKMDTPYFLPRMWVPVSRAKAWEKAQLHYEKLIKVHSKVGMEYKEPTLTQVKAKVAYFQDQLESAPKKWGVDIVPLGWKTKYGSYRYEWNPLISIVAFNRQFCILIGLKSDNTLTNICYWEAWLHYNYDTDKAKSKKERITETIAKRNLTWGSSDKGYTNYYTKILRKKYLKYVKDER